MNWYKKNKKNKKNKTKNKKQRNKQKTERRKRKGEEERGMDKMIIELRTNVEVGDICTRATKKPRSKREGRRRSRE